MGIVHLNELFRMGHCKNAHICTYTTKKIEGINNVVNQKGHYNFSLLVIDKKWEGCNNLTKIMAAMSVSLGTNFSYPNFVLHIGKVHSWPSKANFVNNKRLSVMH